MLVHVINCVGRKVAIDASMSLYQFLIAVRQDGQQLVDSSGETTRSGEQTFYSVFNCFVWGGVVF